MEKLIRELLEKGFVISGVSILERGHLAYELNGFYKSGSVQIYSESNQIYALARYDEVTILDENNSFASLVLLNYNWWQYSKDRLEDWASPNSKWLPYFLEQGLVSEKTETKTTYH